MRLYEIGWSIRNLLADADARGGELTDNDFSEIEKLSLNMEGKVDTICRLVQESTASINARDF